MYGKRSEYENLKKAKETKSFVTAALFEQLISDAGCSEHHKDCLRCKIIHGDWKDCQRQVTALRKCLRKHWQKKSEDEKFLELIGAGTKTH